MIQADRPDRPLYAVATEPKHRLLRIAVYGFWSMEVMPAYRAELRRHTDALLPHGGCRRILVDMSDYPIQSQAIAEGHARIITHGKTQMRATTAVVMTSALSRLQAKRMAQLAGQELFDDEATARAWLLDQPIAE